MIAGGLAGLAWWTFKVAVIIVVGVIILHML